MSLLRLSLVLCLAATGLTARAADAAPLDSGRLLSLAAAELTAHFNLEGELQLELLRPWHAPAPQAADWRLEVLEFPAAPASSLLLRARLLADGQPAGDVTLVLRASLWRDAWAVREPLTANSLFDAAQLEPRRVDTLRDRDAVPVTAGDRNYNFTRSVPAGRLLTWRDVARRPLVRKGEIVEVSAADGLLSVTLKGLAMQSGAHGDVVTVRNPDSRKDFSASVIDEKRVQVRF